MKMMMMSLLTRRGRPEHDAGGRSAQIQRLVPGVDGVQAVSQPVVESGVCTIHAGTRVARVIEVGGGGTEAVTRGLVGGIWTGLDPGR